MTLTKQWHTCTRARDDPYQNMLPKCVCAWEREVSSPKSLWALVFLSLMLISRALLRELSMLSVHSSRLLCISTLSMSWGERWWKEPEYSNSITWKFDVVLTERIPYTISDQKKWPRESQCLVKYNAHILIKVNYMYAIHLYMYMYMYMYMYNTHALWIMNHNETTLLWCNSAHATLMKAVLH